MTPRQSAIEFAVTVPSSTSNLGPGFDVMGMALGLYVTVKVSAILDARAAGSFAPKLKITYDPREDAPTDESNLIWRTVCFVFQSQKHFPPLLSVSLSVANEIPLARGLGSR